MILVHESTEKLPAQQDTCAACGNLSQRLPARGHRFHKDRDHARQKLAELTTRIKELEEVLLKRPELEQEQASLSKTIDAERQLARDRERSLAMELASIDHELGESKGRLARLQGKEAADLQRVSAPLALEAHWAECTADSAGVYVLESGGLVSPQAELLNPDGGEAVAILQPGARLSVTQTLRLPDGTVRGRIKEPHGWVSLLDQAGHRRAIRAHGLPDDAGHWIPEVLPLAVDNSHALASSSLVEDGISSRSAALRGWTARVDVQKTVFCERLQGCLASSSMQDGSAVGPYMLQQFKVTPLARQLSTETISRTVSSKAAEVNSDLTRLDAERAAMELADAESAVVSLFHKVRIAASRNKNLGTVTSRLHYFLQKAKSFVQSGNCGTSFGLLDYWASLVKDLDSDLMQPSRGLRAELKQKENLTPPAAAPYLSDEVDVCEEETHAAQVRIDTMLRTVAELHRQRGERMQEISDLRQKLPVLRTAAGITSAGRQLSTVQSRLRRVQDIISQMAGCALAEIEHVEAWTQLIEDVRHSLVAGLVVEDAICSRPRATNEEMATKLQDLLRQFRPGQTGEGSSGSAGAQSLWWMAANVAAISTYAKVELSELGPAAEVDKRKELYAFADSRFAKEMRHHDDW